MSMINIALDGKRDILTSGAALSPSHSGASIALSVSGASAADDDR